MNNQQINNQQQNVNNVITPKTTPVIVKNSSGGAVVAIILLSLALLGCIGYIYYSIVYLDKDSIISSKEALEGTSIDANGLYQIEDTMKSFEDAFNYYDSKYFGYIYSKDKIKVSDFDDDAALFASIYNKYENSNQSYVSNSEVKQSFNSFFGNSKTYTPKKIKVNDLFTINYDSNTKLYGLSYNGKGGYYYPKYFSTIEKTKVNEDYVYVVRNVGYIEYENESSINIYAADGKKKLVKNVKVKEGSFNPSELVAKYKSNLSQFTYTFKIDGDNYTFESIERIK